MQRFPGPRAAGVVPGRLEAAEELGAQRPQPRRDLQLPVVAVEPELKEEKKERRKEEKGKKKERRKKKQGRTRGIKRKKNKRIKKKGERGQKKQSPPSSCFGGQNPPVDSLVKCKMQWSP